MNGQMDEFRSMMKTMKEQQEEMLNRSRDFDAGSPAGEHNNKQRGRGLMSRRPLPTRQSSPRSADTDRAREPEADAKRVFTLPADFDTVTDQLPEEIRKHFEALLPTAKLDTIPADACANDWIDQVGVKANVLALKGIIRKGGWTPPPAPATRMAYLEVIINEKIRVTGDDDER